MRIALQVEQRWRNLLILRVRKARFLGTCPFIRQETVDSLFKQLGVLVEECFEWLII
jgi:hypothetical protein